MGPGRAADGALVVLGRGDAGGSGQGARTV